MIEETAKKAWKGIVKEQQQVEQKEITHEDVDTDSKFGHGEMKVQDSSKKIEHNQGYGSLEKKSYISHDDQAHYEGKPFAKTT